MPGFLSWLVSKVIRQDGAFLLIALLCLIPAMVCGQIASYPQNDDNMYVWSIEHFCRSGEIKFLASSPTAILPVLLGAAAWTLSGHSFAALHWLSLLFVFATGYGCYRIMQELNHSKSSSLIAATLVFLNPLIINLSTCYMTDLPSLALSTWAMYFCFKGIAKGQTRHWLISVVLLSLALACRQTAVLWLLALALLSLYLIAVKRKDGMLLAALLLLPAALFLFLEQSCQANTIYTQPLASYKQKLLRAALFLWTDKLEGLRYAMLSLAKVSCYIGFYTLPLAAALTSALIRKKKLWGILSVGLLGALALTAFPLSLALKQGQLMPYSFSLLAVPYVGNYSVFHDFLIGWSGERQFQVTIFFIIIGTLFSGLFFVNLQLFLISVFRHFSRLPGAISSRNLFYLFVGSSFAAFEILLVLQSRVINFDRYHLPLLLPAIILFTYALRFLCRKDGFPRLPACLVAIILCLYSNIALADYTSFNHCRWSVIRHLEAGGVSPLEIDGGPEYCLSENPALYSKELANSAAYIDEWGNKERGGAQQAPFRWWPVSGSTYIVSSHGFANYAETYSKRYWSPIDWRWKTISAFKRTE